MREVEFCLNCEAEECDGLYPHCNGKKQKKYRNTKLRQLGRGNASLLVASLVKEGLKRKAIMEICECSPGSLSAVLNTCLKNNLLTQEEIDGTRVYKKHI